MVENLMAARGIDVSYETIRCWTIKFGPQIARRLKKLRPSPSPRWHLDEVVCSIGGKRMFVWRAVDDEGEVLDIVVQRRRDTEAALKLLRRLLRNQPVEPIYNTFYTQRHLVSRATLRRFRAGAEAAWAAATA